MAWACKVRWSLLFSFFSNFTDRRYRNNEGANPFSSRRLFQCSEDRSIFTTTRPSLGTRDARLYCASPPVHLCVFPGRGETTPPRFLSIRRDDHFSFRFADKIDMRTPLPPPSPSISTRIPPPRGFLQGVRTVSSTTVSLNFDEKEVRPLLHQPGPSAVCHTPPSRCSLSPSTTLAGCDDDDGPIEKKELRVDARHTLAHTHGIYCVKFSADGKSLAVASRAKVFIYDVTTGLSTW